MQIGQMRFPGDFPEELRGLSRLAQENGLELRAVLLRVMTDLYLSRAHHTADEIRQFEALFLGLLPQMDAATRDMIAGKLATVSSAPPAILEALLAAGGDGAALIAGSSPILSRKALLKAAVEGAAPTAQAIAARYDLDELVVTALAARGERDVLRLLAANPTAPIGREVFRHMAGFGRADEALGRALCQRSTDNRDLAPLFLWASHLQRAAVLLEARTSILAGLPAKPPGAVQRATATEIETAATSGDWLLFTAILARSLSCTLPQARQILEDLQGEPLVIALGALFMTPEQIARVLMSAGAPLAHAYERIVKLTSLARQMPQAVCARLMREMLEREDTDSPAGRHATVADTGAAEQPSRAADTSRRLASEQKRGGLLFLKKGA